MRLRLVSLGAFLLLLSCGAGTPGSSAAPHSVAPGSDANRAPKASIEMPEGLHHLTVGWMVCALDREGATWCYGAPESGWTESAPNAWWLRKVPGAPPMATLEARTAMRGVCGLAVSGEVVCLSPQGGVRRPVVPDGAERVQGDLVLSTSGQWHFIPIFPEEGDTTWGLPWLDGFASVIPAQRAVGWVGGGPSGSKAIFVSENGNVQRKELKPWFEEHSVLVPSLDGFANITAADLTGALAGCALNDEGAIRCWDKKGEALGPHPADGRGRDVVLADFSDGSTGFCVATDEDTVCSDAESSAEPWTVPFRGARELGAGGSSIYGLCALDDGVGIACARAGLVERVLTPVRGVDSVVQLANGDQGSCAVTQQGALVCWGLVEMNGSEPLAAPTAVVEQGVRRFWLGGPARRGRAWCVETATGVRCESSRWSQAHVLPEGAEPVFVDPFGLCTLHKGRLSCEELREEPSAGLRAVLEGGPWDVFGGSASFGCVSQGAAVTCWDDGESGTLTRLEAPGPVRGLSVGIGRAEAWLADGRVASRQEDDGAITLVADTEIRVGSFEPAPDGWCGSTPQGLLCEAHGTATLHAAANVRTGSVVDGTGCVLDTAGGVSCKGSQEHGETGHPWVPTEVVRLPMRPDDALGELERDMADAGGS